MFVLFFVRKGPDFHILDQFRPSRGWNSWKRIWTWSVKKKFYWNVHYRRSVKTSCLRQYYDQCNQGGKHKAQCTEVIWGREVIASPFFTSEVDGGESSALRHGRFTPGEKTADTRFKGGWVSHRSGPNAVEHRKISCPCQESNRSHSACSPSLDRLSW
jgi:hypothetical protein